MPLASYRPLTSHVLAAPITRQTATKVTAGGTTYPKPPGFGTPAIGDYLVLTDIDPVTLRYVPSQTFDQIFLPMAGPFLVGDRVICVRANPPVVMVIAEVLPDGYRCDAPTFLNRPYFVGADLQAAPP